MAKETILPDIVRSILLYLQLRWYVLFITLLVTANSYFNRVRMSHENGLTCRGRITILDNPEIPAHDLFLPGREFPCRLRHGAASYTDDAKLVVRSASLKFADHRTTAPLDIMMNTGDVPLFWSARTFWGFMKGTIGGRGKAWIPYLKSHPQAEVGGRVGVRRNPTTFAKLVYNSQTCFGFIGEDEVYRYARYRLIPKDFDGHETGIPDARDLATPWFQNPLPDETRNRNYLKDELIHRLDVEKEPVQYTLQIQLRRRPSLSDPEPEWVTSEYPWDEEAHPFHDLADVTLTEALDYQEAMLTWFDLANHVSSLPVPRGRSIDDPHSLNDLRLASIWARKARLLAYERKGMPPKFPNSRKAPDWKGIPPMPNPPG